MFGSHARGEASPTSDVDIAVVRKDIRNRTEVRNNLADIAYEEIVETYIDVHALPVWLNEWEHPARFSLHKAETPPLPTTAGYPANHRRRHP